MSPPSVPVVVMRGGTSKGVFVHTEDLPAPGPERDRLLLEIMGSPDPMQIDGLGGTHSSTSKVVAVERGTGDEQIGYTFAQVGIDSPVVDWTSNCGNLTTAVGPFAIDEGLVAADEPVTTLRLCNYNTGIRLEVEVPVRDGRARTDGDHRTDGVPSTGSPIVTRYLEPAGSVFGRLLPTGTTSTAVAGVAVSIVDVTHPVAVVRATDLGLHGLATPPSVLNQDRDLLQRIESLRAGCAVALGRVTDPGQAQEQSPAIPRLVLVGEPPDTGSDIAALGVSMGKVHHALPMTVGLCLAAASRVPGTVAWQTASPGAGRVRIRHPKGVAEVEVRLDPLDAQHVVSVAITRTARRLLAGRAYLHEPSAVRT